MKDGAIPLPLPGQSGQRHGKLWAIHGLLATEGFAQVPGQAMAQAVLLQDILLSSGMQGHEGQHDFCLSV